jgi:hypothetical protein
LKNELNGTIPTEICNLRSLVHWDLEDNALAGTIPTEIGCLTNLTYWDLQDNAFS